jgi:xanthine dehydrogenase accessory factor
MNRSTLALLSALALALAACGGGSSASSSSDTTAEGDDHHATASTAGSEQPLVPIGEAQIGDRSTCPVSGEEFVVSESSPTVEHDGRTYYFCCPGCAERFQADPHQFLQPQHAEGEGASEG